MLRLTVSYEADAFIPLTLTQLVDAGMVWGRRKPEDDVGWGWGRSASQDRQSKLAIEADWRAHHNARQSKLAIETDRSAPQHRQLNLAIETDRSAPQHRQLKLAFRAGIATWPQAGPHQRAALDVPLVLVLPRLEARVVLGQAAHDVVGGGGHQEVPLRGACAGGPAGFRVRARLNDGVSSSGGGRL